VVLVTLDTTRADHLGCYGYAGDTSPNLDRFAERAVLYERAYSTSSWTTPSHASIFTGLLPMQHGADVSLETRRLRPLGESLTTLAELLAEAGFRNSTVYWEGSDEDGEGNDEYSPVERGDADPAWIAYIVAER
jgi:arylsulfatase A-like enzyme